jgi:hypothetical protein
MSTSSSVLASGVGSIVLNRPCVGGPAPNCGAAIGSVDLTLTAPTWLQGANGTSWPLNPLSRLKFGSPKAPYIYLRERY